MTEPLDKAVAEAIEPVEPATLAPVEAGEPGAPDGQDPETPEPEAPEPGEAKAEKHRHGYARKKEALELAARENAELKLRVAELQRSYEEAQAKLAPPDPTDPGPAPEFGQNGLDDADAFFAAQKRWIADATAYAKHRGQVEYREAEAKAQEDQRLARTRATVTAREEQVTKTRPDYAAVVRPYTQAILSNPVLSDYVARTADEGTLGLEVVYELCKRPELLERVAASDPFAAQRLLVQAEAALRSPPPAKPTTRAAPPITPVGGAQAAGPKSLAELSAADDATAYIQRRRQQTLARGKP